MDSTKSEKAGAMKSSSDQHYQFIYHIFIHSVIALTCLFLCSYPLWFNSFSYFVFIYVPQFWSSFLSPKCLFIVVNVIVFFLVGESKLHSSNSSSPRGSSTTSDVIYSEYVERSQSLRRCRVVDEEINKEESSKLMDQIKLNDEIENRTVVIELNKEVIGVVEPHKEENNKQEEEDEEIYRDQEEYCGLPAEELNKRAEEFIAKINKQRWLEARASFGVCV